MAQPESSSGSPTAPQSPQAGAAKAARLEREARALRENLRRRKAQTRSRAVADTPPADRGSSE